MTLAVYASLGEEDPRFDGHRAWKHLVERLAFRRILVRGSKLEKQFAAWGEIHRERIQTRRPVNILLPPAWF